MIYNVGKESLLIIAVDLVGALVRKHLVGMRKSPTLCSVGLSLLCSKFYARLHCSRNVPFMLVNCQIMLKNVLN